MVRESYIFTRGDKMTKGTLPLTHNIQFIRRFDAFFREYKAFEDPIKDLEEFWKEYKYEIYAAYRDASYWREFKGLIEVAQDDS